MNFYTDVIQKHPLYHSPNRCAALGLLEPIMRQAVQRFMAASPVPLMVFETYRSSERQIALFNAKATELRTVGVHHYGLACDLVKVVNGQPSWKGDFSFFAPLAKEMGLISGLNWGQPDSHHSFIDSDHVQRITVARQVALFAGTWYPDDAYDPYKDG
jgi:hypothetical protein